MVGFDGQKILEDLGYLDWDKEITEKEQDAIIQEVSDEISVKSHKMLENYKKILAMAKENVELEDAIYKTAEDVFKKYKVGAYDLSCLNLLPIENYEDAKILRNLAVYELEDEFRNE